MGSRKRVVVQQRALEVGDRFVAARAGGDFRRDATKCGEAEYDASHEPEPYVLYCGGASGSYVTMKLLGASTYLSIAELEVRRRVWNVFDLV